MNYFSKIDSCRFNNLPIEYRIIIKLFLKSKLNFNEIIRLKKKDFHLNTIKLNKQIINIKAILNEVEFHYIENNLKHILKNEYIFDSSKTRLILKYNILSYSDIKSKNNKINRLSSGAHPNVIVLGSPKCATTWFYNICKNLNFFDPSEKEIEFFGSIRYCNGEDWYRSKFFSKNENIKIDVSVGYFDNEMAIKRIYKYQNKHNLNFKILLFIRKPSSRIKSYINYRKLTGRGWYNIKKYVNSGHVYNNFIKTSDYLKGVSKVQNYFKADQLFIAFHEDILKNPKECYRQILNFIDPQRYHEEIDTIDEKFFQQRYNIGKRVILFPIFKFIFNFEKYLIFKFRRSNHLKKIRKIIELSTRYLRDLLIIQSNKEINYFSKKSIEIVKLNKKYGKIKEILKNKQISFTNINN